MNMRFGVREICDVVFKALQGGTLGKMNVVKGQPVLFIDSAKTSTIEGASTTVYATGGKGNARLLSWEGERTLTFTVEDALLSPIGFSILSGAGLFEADLSKPAYVHTTSLADVKKKTRKVESDEGQKDEEYYEVPFSGSKQAPIFVLKYVDGMIGDKLEHKVVETTEDGKTVVTLELTGVKDAETVFVDYYVAKQKAVTEMQIDAENFGGFYYVEASTLFRRESDGKDLPAEIVFPKVKIQSNFTFNMASNGDPSTFTFTMDAMPAYTVFNKNKKCLCAMQVIEEASADKDNEAVTMSNSTSSFTW